MLSDIQYCKDIEVSKMSTYMMMPKDYARELIRQGQRDKASAFMEYMFDLDEKKNNSLRFYALNWGIGKTTASRWIEDFKDEIARHFDYWTIQNELKYRGTAAGQGRDSKRDSKTTTNANFNQPERDSKKNGLGTVAGQSINTKINKESISGQNKFVAPSIQEIQDFIASKNLNVDAKTFFYHYESNGWMVGKNKMKSWTATVQKWNSDKKTSFQQSTDTKKQVYGGLI